MKNVMSLKNIARGQGEMAMVGSFEKDSIVGKVVGPLD